MKCRQSQSSSSNWQNCKPKPDQKPEMQTEWVGKRGERGGQFGTPAM